MNKKICANSYLSNYHMRYVRVQKYKYTIYILRLLQFPNILKLCILNKIFHIQRSQFWIFSYSRKQDRMGLNARSRWRLPTASRTSVPPYAAWLRSCRRALHGHSREIGGRTSGASESVGSHVSCLISKDAGQFKGTSGHFGALRDILGQTTCVI